MEREYTTASGVKRYEHSVILAVNNRTETTVTDISMIDRTLTLTLDSEPTQDDVNEIDDILAVTERYRESKNGNELTYKLREFTEQNPADTLEARLMKAVSSDKSRGSQRSSVAYENMNANAISKGVKLSLPQSATADDVSRADNVALALGKVPKENSNAGGN
jgi:hypothetical protein